MFIRVAHLTSSCTQIRIRWIKGFVEKTFLFHRFAGNADLLTAALCERQHVAAAHGAGSGKTVGQLF
jgi:hypothetical protein